MPNGIFQRQLCSHLFIRKPSMTPHCLLDWVQIPHSGFPGFIPECLGLSSPDFFFHLPQIKPTLSKTRSSPFPKYGLSALLFSPAGPLPDMPSPISRCPSHILWGLSNAISCRKKLLSSPARCYHLFPVNSQNMMAWTSPETLLPVDLALWTFVDRSHLPWRAGTELNYF